MEGWRGGGMWTCLWYLRIHHTFTILNSHSLLRSSRFTVHCKGQMVRYAQLAVLPFDSTRKRASGACGVPSIGPEDGGDYYWHPEL